MFKTLFTRKNLLFIGLTILYAFLLLFTGMCIEGSYTMVSKRNPFVSLANSLGFQPIAPGVSGFICLVLVAIYIVVCVSTIIYERRYAIVNNKNPHSIKMIGTYTLTVLACLVLSLGVGLIIQRPLTWDNISIVLLFVAQALAITSIIYVIAFLLIGAIVMLVVNFIHIDKPFRFFNNNEEPVFDDEDLVEHDVTGSFDVDANVGAPEGFGPVAGGAGGVGGAVGGDGTVVRTAETLDDSEKVFPSLSRIDNEYEGFVNDVMPYDEIALNEICTRFRNYLAQKEKLYFNIDVIRFFVSGFAASHFEILEGLSGTGKSSLPRHFAKFVGGRALFMPVQATWRDKSNILGFFNEFSKTYSETDFLVELYRANYNPDQLFIFVLDEMNISRVEYYFADLLSVLEYPQDEWKLKIMHVPHDFIPPVKLEDGNIQITPNSYFVGTANKDDSTFTITDKVYDRAITTEFEYKNDAFEVDGNSEAISLSSSRLNTLYADALSKEENKLSQYDYDKMNAICNFVYEQFDIAIGNRILNQIDNIVPVFVACGGKKETAIDFMLSKKLIGKIEGRFEDYVKGALKDLLDLINKTYGEGVLVRCEKTIKNIMRML